MLMTMSLAVFAYPVWVGAGLAFGLLFAVSSTQFPGGGLASPNLVHTVLVAVATAVAVGLAVAVLRRVVIGTLSLGVVFAGVFGWLLPYLAR